VNIARMAITQNGDSPAGTNVKGALLRIAETVSKAVTPKPTTVRKTDSIITAFWNLRNIDGKMRIATKNMEAIQGNIQRNVNTCRL